MIRLGKFPVLGVNIQAVDYEAAVSAIIEAAEKGVSCSVSALAVHGVMTGFLAIPTHSRRLNALDLVVPDGQPVRWALRWLHGISLSDRVYGPNLTLHTAKALAEKGLGVYLYGSKTEVLEKFAANLMAKFPGLKIAGLEPSKFRKLSEQERSEVVQRVRASGAQAVFVGLGCPRQEVWAYEYRSLLNMPILAVGAAFDFHAGSLPQAPAWMQNAGLEWLFRFWQEPGRLWKRYTILNPLYLWNVALQKIGLRNRAAENPRGDEPMESYG